MLCLILYNTYVDQHIYYTFAIIIHHDISYYDNIRYRIIVARYSVLTKDQGSYEVV